MHECVLGCFSPIRPCSPMNCGPQGPLSREERRKKKKGKTPSPNTKYLSHENPYIFPRSFLQGFCFNSGLWHWSDSKRDDWHYTFRSLFMRDSGIAASARAGWTHSVLPRPLCHPRAGPQTPSQALASAGDQSPLPDPQIRRGHPAGGPPPGGRGVCRCQMSPVTPILLMPQCSIKPHSLFIIIQSEGTRRPDKFSPQ